MSLILSSIQFLACSTCMTDRGGVTQKAANLGIFMMLGVLVLIFGCLAVTAYNFAKRARKHAQGS